MSFTLLTTQQYDATKYMAIGTVVLNRVESISLLRSAFAGFGAAFGGKNTLIQTAVDNLQARSYGEFTAKVQQTYPNTVQVVALHTDISEVGRDDNATYMVMTMSGTCLVPLNQMPIQSMSAPMDVVAPATAPVQAGGKRKTLKKRYH